MKKIILVIAVLATIFCGGYYYTFIYSKNHHRDAQSEKAIIISADSLISAYQKNEQAANSLYLNKAVEVTGTIISINKDQAGHTTILLGNTESFSNVSVTLLSTNAITKNIGELATVKGVCTGNLSDVIINEGVLK
jgi:hypothetical protein